MKDILKILTALTLFYFVVAAVVSTILYVMMDLISEGKVFIGI